MSLYYIWSLLRGREAVQSVHNLLSSIIGGPRRDGSDLSGAARHRCRFPDKQHAGRNTKDLVEEDCKLQVIVILVRLLILQPPSQVSF